MRQPQTVDPCTSLSRGGQADPRANATQVICGATVSLPFDGYQPLSQNSIGKDPASERVIGARPAKGEEKGDAILSAHLLSLRDLRLF